MESQRKPFVDAAANPPVPANVSVASVCFGGEPLVLNASWANNNDVLDRLCKELAKQKTLICVQDIGIRFDPGQQYTINNVEIYAKRAFEKMLNTRCHTLWGQGHMYVVASFVLSLDTDLYGNYHANAILAHNLDPRDYVNLTPGAYIDDEFRLRAAVVTHINETAAFSNGSARQFGREPEYTDLDAEMIFPDRWRIAAVYFLHLKLFVVSATPKDEEMFCKFAEKIIWDTLLDGLEKVFDGNAKTDRLGLPSNAQGNFEVEYASKDGPNKKKEFLYFEQAKRFLTQVRGNSGEPLLSRDPLSLEKKKLKRKLKKGEDVDADLLTYFGEKEPNIFFTSSAGASAPSKFEKVFPYCLNNGRVSRSNRNFRQIHRVTGYDDNTQVNDKHPSYIFHSYYSPPPAPVSVFNSLTQRN